MTKKTLKIALCGMTSNTRSTFTYFIEKHASKDCALVRLEQAEALILDYDSPAGRLEWKKMDEKLRLSAVLLASEDPMLTDVIYIKKPVKSSDLSKAIKSLVSRCKQPLEARASKGGAVDEIKPANPEDAALKNEQAIPEKALGNDEEKPKAKKTGYSKSIADESSSGFALSEKEIIECCGSQKDINKDDHEQHEVVKYDADRTLLKTVKKAIQIAKQKQCLVNIGLPEPIIVLPGGEYIYANMDSRVIRHVCAMPLQTRLKLTGKEISLVEAEKKFPFTSRHLYSVEQVIWKIALWTSRGRLPKGVELSQAVQLKSWPNFTRLLITPHATRVAAHWVSRSVSPCDLASQLEIPQRYVFALAAAASALDEFSVEESGEQSPAQGNSWKKSQGLFNNILRSLKLSGQ